MLRLELKCIIILSIGIAQLEAARILAFFPSPSLSHQVTFHPLTNELVKRGHEVTVITTDPFYPKGQAPGNLTEVDIHDMSYSLGEQLLSVVNSKKTVMTQIFLLAKMYTQLFEQQMLLPEVQTILKKDKKYFDLIFVEACFRSTLILSHIFEAPMVQISSLGPLMNNLEEIGAPTNPLLYPTLLHKRIYNLSYWEKVKELHSEIWIRIISVMHEDYENEMFRRNFGPNAPTIHELRNNIDMLFLNVNPMWNGNIPVPPGVIYTGGIHIKPQKELPQDLKSFLDSSKNGVIYISFGTNVKINKIAPEATQKFINVLSKLPYDVLWKWDQDELPERSANIKMSKWLPQSDLLRHPKVKLFVTQGGLQSTDETILAGVPVIGVPIFGDQWYNVENYLHFKIGRRIDIENFTEEDFREAVNAVISDESYRKNIEKLRAIMYDQPQTSLERGIWWTEHLLRHGGGRHLRAPAANMTYAEYYELKLIGTVLLTLAILIYVFVKILKYVWRLNVKLLNSVKRKMA